MPCRYLQALTYVALWLLVLFTHAACRTSTEGTSSTQDIATNSGGGPAGGVYLYLREGELISRTACPAGLLAVNYDRAHCLGTKQSVPAKPFIDALSTGVGAGIDAHAKNVQDLYAGIAAAQLELLQLLEAVPATQAQLSALRQQLINAEAGIAAMQAQLGGFDQQIAAIKARLATDSGIDLNIQLGKLLDERATLLGRQNQAKDAEQARREAFIAANSSTLDQDTYTGVEAQQSGYRHQLEGELAALTSAMQEVSSLNKTIAHISDPTFTFSVIEGQPAFQRLAPFTKRLKAVFDGLWAGDPPSFYGVADPIMFQLPRFELALRGSNPAKLPSWAKDLVIEVDGKVRVVPAASSVIVLPLEPSRAAAGSHRLRATFRDDNGNTGPAYEAEVRVIPDPVIKPLGLTYCNWAVPTGQWITEGIALAPNDGLDAWLGYTNVHMAIAEFGQNPAGVFAFALGGPRLGDFRIYREFPIVPANLPAIDLWLTDRFGNSSNHLTYERPAGCSQR